MSFGSLLTKVLAIMAAVSLMLVGVGLLFSLNRIRNAPEENATDIFVEVFERTVLEIVDPVGAIVDVIVAAIITIILMILLYFGIVR